MATLSKGHTFSGGETVTAAKLNSLVDSATISGIVNSEIDASAAIALSKLATGALPTGITVASANIVDGTIVNSDISAAASIAGTKIAPNFGSQNIATTGTGSFGTTTSGGTVTAQRAAASAGWVFRGQSSGVANESGLFIDGSNHALFDVRNGSGTLAASVKSSGISFFNGGAVGIGTATPAANSLLHVFSSAGGTRTIVVQNTGTTAATQARLDLVTGTSNSNAIAGLTESGSGSSTFELSNGSAVTGGMFFSSATSTTPLILRQGTTERVRLNNNGNLAFVDGSNLSFATSTGTKIGTATTQKLGFFDKTPVVQPAGANQAALTNSTGGTADGTLSAVSGTGDDADINNNFTELHVLLNEIRTVLVNLGLMKGAA